jgi:peptidoglycan/LPS O-acetylase OafA/YrhL
MNRQLAAFRGLAALLVVMNHSIHLSIVVPRDLGYGGVAGPWRYVALTLVQLGVFAVPIFLFISGCFAVYASQAGSGKGWRPPWHSLKYTLAPYLVWSLLFYLIAFMATGQRDTPVGYVKSLLVGYPFHFVPLYVFFTLLSPLLVWLLRRHGWKVLAAVGLYQVALLLLLEPDVLGREVPGWAWLIAPPVLSRTMADWAIFFPLGMYYGLHVRTLSPRLYTLRWGLAAATLLLFVLYVLHGAGLLRAPLVGALSATVFMGIAAGLKRDSLRFAWHLEQVGKRAYPLYLTNLVTANAVLLLIRALAPDLLGLRIVLPVVLFVVALGLPMAVMAGLDHWPRRSQALTRYVFG